MSTTTLAQMIWAGNLEQIWSIHQISNLALTTIDEVTDIFDPIPIVWYHVCSHDGNTESTSFIEDLIMLS